MIVSLSTPTSPNPPPWTFEPTSHRRWPAFGPEGLADEIRRAAPGLGLAGLGFASVEPFEDAHRVFAAWIEAGYNGTMAYLGDAPRHDPRSLAPHVQTLVVGAMSVAAVRGYSHVARYAAGGDYHVRLRQKLSALGQAIADLCGRTVVARACVDTAPLLEREAARRAGIGFIGKSNLLIMPGIGSHVLLGALLLDVGIAVDSPAEQRCGRCTSCLDACPTRAFVGPWILDARRCISYLTIEYRGWISASLRPLMGTHVFGCDICQDICPYNRGKDALTSREASAEDGELPNVELSAWLTLTSSGYRRLSAGSALRRASRWQLLRNAAVAAGNSRDLGLVASVVRLLVESKYPIVRGHAAWALGRLGNSDAVEGLQRALLRECDADVVHEIQDALAYATRDGAEKAEDVSAR